MKKNHYFLNADESRVVYLINPKCACTTLKNLVVENNITMDVDSEQVGLDGAFAHLDKMANIEPYSRYFKFSFVRNPFDRLVSAYLDKIVPKNKVKKSLGLYPGFEKFVSDVVRTPDDKADLHWRSQYLNMVDNQGKLLPDFIGKFENLEEDINILCNKIGYKAIIGHYRKSKRRSAWSTYYNPLLIKIVADRYKKDFEIFDYDPAPISQDIA